MKNRVERLCEKLCENNLDSIIITDLNNVRYFSSFSGTSAYLVISQNKRYLITDFRYIEQASKQCDGFEIIDYKNTDIKKLVKNFKNTGFENETISYKDYVKFSSVFKNLVSVNDIVNTLREIKDEEEIENIKKAVEIADSAFSYLVKYMKVGMSEKQIADELEFFMRKNGAEKLSFDSIVASGIRGAMPHGYPTEKHIENGELVVLDFGCFYNGYASDMTRTVAVGNVSDILLDMYNTTLTAQLSAIEKISSGKKCKDIHSIAQKTIDEKYPDAFGHALGHGVGLEIHEMPTVHSKSEKILEEGNVISVEPGIYIPSVGGVRIEDLVLITKNGCDVLTKSTKKLIYI
jgi:Xaa-Pro aminopeptidase